MSFKKHGQSSAQGSSKRSSRCHVCGETGHYARECKDRKSGPTANSVEEVANLVANVDLGGVYMITSLTRARAARGWFVDTGPQSMLADRGMISAPIVQHLRGLMWFVRMVIKPRCRDLAT